MSAIEIYNEKVRDLLKDGTERQNLPLLDDPERGTVAEGLSEEWPRSEQHLCQLLRQIETRRTVSHLYRLHYVHLLCVPVYQQTPSQGVYIVHGCMPLQCTPCLQCNVCSYIETCSSHESQICSCIC